MKARKWNFNKKEYEAYKLPDGASMFEADMTKQISCAACGHEVEYGTSYTSRQIHNEYGLGFMVCSSCYDNEKDMMSNE